MAAPLVLWESLNTFNTLLSKTPFYSPHDVFIIIWPWLSLPTRRSFCPRGIFYFFLRQPLIAWLTLSRAQWRTFRAPLHIKANNGCASLHTCKLPHTALTLCLTLSVDSESNYMPLRDNCFWVPHWPQALCFLPSTWKLWCLKLPNGRKNTSQIKYSTHWYF